MPALSQSPRYRSFIQDRNRALEKILQNSLSRVDQVLHRLENMSVAVVMVHEPGLGTPAERQRKVEAQLTWAYNMAAEKINVILYRLRLAAFTLAYSGEAEAIGRSTTGASRAQIDAKMVKDVEQKPSPSGGDTKQRILLSLERLKRRVIDAAHMSYVADDGNDALIRRVKLAFPKRKKLMKNPRRKLKGPRRVVEARRKYTTEDTFSVPGTGRRKIGVTTGFIDDVAWDTMVSEYLGDQTPPRSLRAPEAVIGVEEQGREVPRYVWELEKEATEDFVARVRDGQIQAANDNGITDFVWLAIIDDKTDDCCAWRDGLTSVEIEAGLRGKHKDDECQAVVPPAHFNCATAGHVVTTRSGPKPIEQIRVGDEVITHKNRFQKVTRCVQSMSDSLIRIKMKNGTTITITEEHPFLSDGQWVAAKYLMPGATLDGLVAGNDNPDKAPEGT